MSARRIPQKRKLFRLALGAPLVLGALVCGAGCGQTSLSRLPQGRDGGASAADTFAAAHAPAVTRTQNPEADAGGGLQPVQYVEPAFQGYPPGAVKPVELPPGRGHPYAAPPRPQTAAPPLASGASPAPVGTTSRYQPPAELPPISGGPAPGGLTAPSAANTTVLPLPADAPAAGLPGHAPKAVPISLDTVFRLAQDQNLEVNLAREQLHEAFANRDLAQKAWLPDLYVGPSWFRHEGGIQDQDGMFIHSSYGSLFGGVEMNARIDVRDLAYQRVEAERKIWQKRGELSRLTSDQLLDATQTYVDLLAAKAGEAISREVEGDLEDLLGRAEKLAKVEQGVKVEAERIRAELMAQRRITRMVRESTQSAAAKVNQLLGLDPCTELVVTEQQLAPVNLIDPKLCAQDLINQAWANGPGVRDMEGLLALIQDSQVKSQGLAQYLPVVQLRAAEGAFGAAPGASLVWDNRLDLALQARWNLTAHCTAGERRRVLQSQVQQAHLSYAQLRSKLALGVQEATYDSASSADQIALARQQIEYAREAYRLSSYRFKERLPGSSAGEVLLAVRTVAAARLEYLNALRDYDKAQLRLFVLTGKASAGHHE